MNGTSNSHPLASRLMAIALALAASPFGPWAAEAAPPPRSAANSEAAVIAAVRAFYAWYLGELSAGRRPANDETRLRAFMTDAAIAEARRSALPAFDPVLALPEPHGHWQSMKVAIGRPRFYHQRGVYDAYVEVTYSGFADPVAHRRNGTRFVGIPDLWSVGVSRTAQGWRIASIGLGD